LDAASENVKSLPKEEGEEETGASLES